ncbi:UDP-N-acetylglucosamine transferase subunit alg13 [Penicillium malachiteum]|nr:UDP-N-acetylglucosamine transferase subunit alg13 [Penicillium malachiteum]
MSGTSASRGSSAKLRAETPPMMMMKLCLVTIGATAAFNTLISEVMDEPFFAKLKQTGFTHLIVQYGVAGKDIFDAFLAKHPEGDPGLHGIGLGGFALTPDMHPYFMMAKNRRTRNQELGLVICHSGTGTILEALRHGLPMVVVPNPDLADNHQEDLARKVDQLKWGVMGKIGDVCAAIDKAEALQNEDNSFEEESVDSMNLAMDDELSFVD